jgi:hypothetical protein
MIHGNREDVGRVTGKAGDKGRHRGRR